MLPAPGAGNDMVEGKLPEFPAAILAGKFITPEYLQPRHSPVGTVGPPCHRRQPYHGGNREIAIDGVDESGAVFQHFRLFLVDKDYRPADAADIERFVALVQYKNGTIKHSSYIPCI
jgi:hypothetical protein